MEGIGKHQAVVETRDSINDHHATLLRLIDFVARVVVGSVFLYAGIGKLNNIFAFYNTLLGHNIFSAAVARLVAQCLPWLEICLALCMFCRLLYAGTLVILVFLAATFFFITSRAWVLDLHVGCGCFGAAEQDQITGYTVLRTFAILLASLVLILINKLLGARRKRVGRF